MSPFRESIKHLAQKVQTCEVWLEMARDLSLPIAVPKPDIDFQERWATKADLFTINALEGFVNETSSMEDSLDHGDRCLLLEKDGAIFAFAWVTFRDYKLALWYTLRLPAHGAYLVYIYVSPGYQGKGVGSYLMGALVLSLRDLGYRKLVSGMYSNWEVSIRLHARTGFQLHRRLTQCKLLDIFPYPPRSEMPGVDAGEGPK